MKRFKMLNVGNNLLGYTIVEAMIFLAVSGGLLVASGTIISGRQEKARFSQTVVDIEQNLQDIFNDVSTGYFPSNGDFSCTTAAAPSPLLTISAPAIGGNPQGTNEGCVFVGKLIQFTLSSPNYTVYTMVGRRDATALTGVGAGEVKLLGAGGNRGIAELKSNNIGLNTVRLVESTPPPLVDHRSIAVVAEFGTTTGSSVSGNSARVKLYSYDADITAGALAPGSFKLLTSPIIICFAQSATKVASLKISPQLTMDRLINGDELQC